MKTKKQALLFSLCAVLLVAVSVFGTVAYLTAQKQVVNTFTVGAVEIQLDEQKVDAYGKADGTERVTANEYKLLPGHTYTKDPTVTVLQGSESAYIKMTVTFTKSAELDAVFAPEGADMTTIFGGYDGATWIYKGNTEDASANTRTYEFWYKDTVAASEADVCLSPLFSSITVPGSIDGAQLQTIRDMTITVNAYAIQADGFATADAAWEAFGK